MEHVVAGAGEALIATNERQNDLLVPQPAMRPQHWVVIIHIPVSVSYQNFSQTCLKSAYRSH
jgi:hypothetical protein